MIKFKTFRLLIYAPTKSCLRKNHSQQFFRPLQKVKFCRPTTHLVHSVSPNNTPTTKQQILSFIKNNTKNTHKAENTFWNYTFDKGRLKSFVSWFLREFGEFKTIQLIEELKNIGFDYATKAGISLGIDDLKIPPVKANLFFEADVNAKVTNDQYKRGEITAVERFQRLIETWHRTSELLKQEVVSYFEETNILNPVYMMAFSGARGNISQVRQLVGMRGLMSDPQGQLIDYPIRSNFREGLTVTEYIISCYGARKGIVDTALRTANAGYLTRRLVDVAQHVMISLFDCGTKRGIYLSEMKEGKKILYSLQNRLVGRVLAKNIYLKSTNSLDEQTLDEKKGDVPFYRRNQEISPEVAVDLAKVSTKIFVRSPLTCSTKKLVCQLCYGWSLAQGNLVSIGEAVGVIAGQSIGEPGTQLTMRTFHTGGAFSGDISDQVRAPFNGIVFYEAPIAGVLIRNPDGRIVFLTKVEGVIFIYPTKEMNSSSITPNEFLAEKNLVEFEKYGAKKYKIPSYTVLYARNGENVSEKQVVAQMSSLNIIDGKLQQNIRDDAEFVVKTQIEGELYIQQLTLSEKFIGPKWSANERSLAESGFHFNDSEFSKKRDRIFESWDWGFSWILSGKMYQLPISSKLIPKPGDFLTKTSALSQIQWFLGKPYSQLVGIEKKASFLTNPLWTNNKKNHSFLTFNSQNLSLRSPALLVSQNVRTLQEAKPVLRTPNYASSKNQEGQNQSSFWSRALPSMVNFKLERQSTSIFNQKVQLIKFGKTGEKKQPSDLMFAFQTPLMSQSVLSFDFTNMYYKKIGYFLGFSHLTNSKRFIQSNKGLKNLSLKALIFVPIGIQNSNNATNSDSFLNIQGLKSNNSGEIGSSKTTMLSGHVLSKTRRLKLIDQKNLIQNPQYQIFNKDSESLNNSSLSKPKKYKLLKGKTETIFNIYPMENTTYLKTNGLIFVECLGWRTPIFKSLTMASQTRPFASLKNFKARRTTFWNSFELNNLKHKLTSFTCFPQKIYSSNIKKFSVKVSLKSPLFSYDLEKKPLLAQCFPINKHKQRLRGSSVFSTLTTQVNATKSLKVKNQEAKTLFYHVSQTFFKGWKKKSNSMQSQEHHLYNTSVFNESNGHGLTKDYRIQKESYSSVIKAKQSELNSFICPTNFQGISSNILKVNKINRNQTFLEMTTSHLRTTLTKKKGYSLFYKRSRKNATSHPTSKSFKKSSRMYRQTKFPMPLQTMYSINPKLNTLASGGPKGITKLPLGSYGLYKAKGELVNGMNFYKNQQELRNMEQVLKTTFGKSLYKSQKKREGKGFKTKSLLKQKNIRLGQRNLFLSNFKSKKVNKKLVVLAKLFNKGVKSFSNKINVRFNKTNRIYKQSLSRYFSHIKNKVLLTKSHHLNMKLYLNYKVSSVNGGFKTKKSPLTNLLNYTQVNSILESKIFWFNNRIKLSANANALITKQSNKKILYMKKAPLIIKQSTPTSHGGFYDFIVNSLNKFKIKQTVPQSNHSDIMRYPNRNISQFENFVCRLKKGWILKYNKFSNSLSPSSLKWYTKNLVLGGKICLPEKKNAIILDSQPIFIDSLTDKSQLTLPVPVTSLAKLTKNTTPIGFRQLQLNLNQFNPKSEKQAAHTKPFHWIKNTKSKFKFSNAYLLTNTLCLEEFIKSNYLIKNTKKKRFTFGLLPFFSGLLSATSTIFANFVPTLNKPTNTTLASKSYKIHTSPFSKSHVTNPASLKSNSNNNGVYKQTNLSVNTNNFNHLFLSTPTQYSIFNWKRIFSITEEIILSNKQNSNNNGNGVYTLQKIYNITVKKNLKNILASGLYKQLTNGKWFFYPEFNLLKPSLNTPNSILSICPKYSIYVSFALKEKKIPIIILTRKSFRLKTNKIYSLRFSDAIQQMRGDYKFNTKIPSTIYLTKKYSPNLIKDSSVKLISRLSPFKNKKPKKQTFLLLSKAIEQSSTNVADYKKKLLYQQTKSNFYQNLSLNLVQFFRSPFDKTNLIYKSTLSTPMEIQRTNFCYINPSKTSLVVKNAYKKTNIFNKKTITLNKTPKIPKKDFDLYPICPNDFAIEQKLNPKNNKREIYPKLTTLKQKISSFYQTLFNVSSVVSTDTKNLNSLVGLQKTHKSFPSPFGYFVGFCSKDFIAYSSLLPLPTRVGVSTLPQHLIGQKEGTQKGRSKRSASRSHKQKPKTDLLSVLRHISPRKINKSLDTNYSYSMFLQRSCGEISRASKPLGPSQKEKKQKEKVSRLAWLTWTKYWLHKTNIKRRELGSHAPPRLKIKYQSKNIYVNPRNTWLGQNYMFIYRFKPALINGLSVKIKMSHTLNAFNRFKTLFNSTQNLNYNLWNWRIKHIGWLKDLYNYFYNLPPNIQSAQGPEKSVYAEGSQGSGQPLRIDRFPYPLSQRGNGEIYYGNLEVPDVAPPDYGGRERSQRAWSLLSKVRRYSFKSLMEQPLFTFLLIKKLQKTPNFAKVSKNSINPLKQPYFSTKFVMNSITNTSFMNPVGTTCVHSPFEGELIKLYEFNRFQENLLFSKLAKNLQNLKTKISKTKGLVTTQINFPSVLRRSSKKMGCLFVTDKDCLSFYAAPSFNGDSGIRQTLNLSPKESLKNSHISSLQTKSIKNAGNGYNDPDKQYSLQKKNVENSVIIKTSLLAFKKKEKFTVGKFIFPGQSVHLSQTKPVLTNHEYGVNQKGINYPGQLIHLGLTNSHGNLLKALLIFPDSNTKNINSYFSVVQTSNQKNESFLGTKSILPNFSLLTKKDYMRAHSVNYTNLPIENSLVKPSTLNLDDFTSLIEGSSSLNNWMFTIRKAQPLLISEKSILHALDGDFIQEKIPIVTLAYQTLKTGDIIQGIPKVEQFFEARTTKRGRLFLDNIPNVLRGLFLYYKKNLEFSFQQSSKSTSRTISKTKTKTSKKITSKRSSKQQQIKENLETNALQIMLALKDAVRQSLYKIQQITVDGVLRVYKSQGVTIADKHLEIIVKQMTSKVKITQGGQTGFFAGELVNLEFVEFVNSLLLRGHAQYEPHILGITKSSLEVESFISAASFQQTTKILSLAALSKKKDFLKGLKENVIIGNLIPAGTGYYHKFVNSTLE